MKSWFLVVGCLALVLVIGCGPVAHKPGPAPTPPGKPAEAKEHSHGAGPHGGAIADWGGGKYHVEFKVDHDKKEATVYILGGDEKTPAPIKAEKIQLSIKSPMFEVDLVAKPQEGEIGGVSSRFIGTHDNLGKVQEFAGTISGLVEGTPYTGDFAETPEM